MQIEFVLVSRRGRSVKRTSLGSLTWDVSVPNKGHAVNLGGKRYEVVDVAWECPDLFRGVTIELRDNADEGNELI